jgi:2-polyprenyl-3-methyl-5-hydroxy-6-metoxy-1,4-benzoquinol methylase
MSLSRRRLEPELMDDPGLPGPDLARALAGLERLNTISMAAGAIWSRLRPLAAHSARPLKLLDVAVGSGDVLVSLAARARRAGIGLELHACDIRPEMLDAAQSRAQAAGFRVSTFRFDARTDELSPGFDVAVSSLFFHHLTDADAAALLGKLGRAARHVIVSDLRRSRLNAVLVWLGSRLATRSRIVHTDAILSIRAAFTPDVFAEMARGAGLTDVRVRDSFPARFILTARGNA